MVRVPGFAAAVDPPPDPSAPAPCVAAGVGGGAETGGGKLDVKCHIVIVKYPIPITRANTMINPFAIRAGLVLVMWLSSCEVIIVFLSYS